MRRDPRPALAESQEPLPAVAGGGAGGREVGSGEGSMGPPPEQCAGMCLICLRDV